MWCVTEMQQEASDYDQDIRHLYMATAHDQPLSKTLVRLSNM